jgi:Rps23 Pro-64 3,4-dihydroxylase Tpa1-like proline 4-hydroxylase
MNLLKISKNIILINKIFPNKFINRINKLFFEEKKWKLINQVRKSHYSYIFKNKSKFMPDKNEVYYAKFYRSFELQNNQIIIRIIKKYITPVLKKLNIKFKNMDIRCHKFIENNFLRTHFDHYAGKCAVTINLNKNWKADWGGNLCILDGKNFDNVKILVPEYNSMNITISKNKKKKINPHFVTRVEKFAKEPRFSITIFFD